MVEIDSENSSILESPETMEKKDKAWKLEELEEEISKLRYKKELEEGIRKKRDLLTR